MKLSDNDIQLLQRLGLISSDETALKEDDIVIAVNVKTQAKRIIETKNVILEANKKLLHD